jgi:hypothetical protein
MRGSIENWKGNRIAGNKSVPVPSPETSLQRANSSDLWENWRRACPFTAGKHFFNVGVTHEVAFAADSFGGFRKIPENFDGWEELARKIEPNYVRGWVARDGSRMFLWDNFNEILMRKSGHFEYFKDALLRLQRKRYAMPHTELWDIGGERYIGELGELSLVVDKATANF